MGSRRGLFGGVWSTLQKALNVAKQERVFIGRDKHGNNYYEKPADDAKGLKRVRMVERADKDEWTPPTVPIEWMPWLQGRRDLPPTEEEIQKNYDYMVRTQHRARELEEQRGDLETRETLPAPDSQKQAFPKYTDLESEPGEFKKKGSSS